MSLDEFLDGLGQTVHKNSGRFWETCYFFYFIFSIFFNIIIIIIIIFCPAVKGSKLRSLPKSGNIHRKSAPVTTIQPFSCTKPPSSSSVSLPLREKLSHNHNHSQPPPFHQSTKKYNTSNNQNKKIGQLQPITITETHLNYQPVSCAPTQNNLELVLAESGWKPQRPRWIRPETSTTSPDPPETHAHRCGFDKSGTPPPALSPAVPFPSSRSRRSVEIPSPAEERRRRMIPARPTSWEFSAKSLNNVRRNCADCMWVF
jgi:hypothetical protein